MSDDRAHAARYRRPVRATRRPPSGAKGRGAVRGYPREEANARPARQHGLVASFSGRWPRASRSISPTASSTPPSTRRSPASPPRSPDRCADNQSAAPARGRRDGSPPRRRRRAIMRCAGIRITAVTTEQLLVGAMGLASWRTRHRLLEYQAVAPAGGTIGVHGGLPTIAASHYLGLNEVGVTDEVMTALWSFGPESSAYAVTSKAESNHLGADIALVHSASQRILLYQAKLAARVGGTFDLKSDVTKAQLKRLQRKSVTIGGQTYSVTGRLALYQADYEPFLSRCKLVPAPLWFTFWPWNPMLALASLGPHASPAETYYEEVLRHGCSPSGVVASNASGSDPIGSVAVAATWPWEFETYSWLRASGSGASGGAPDQQGETAEPPEFTSFEPTLDEPFGEAASVAQQLAAELTLPASWQLSVIIL